MLRLILWMQFWPRIQIWLQDDNIEKLVHFVFFYFTKFWLPISKSFDDWNRKGACWASEVKGMNF